MIWHFLEVWGLLLVAFAAGCLLGTLLYVAIAASPLAGAQVAAADSIGGALGGFRLRAGGGRRIRRLPAASGAGTIRAVSSACLELTLPPEWTPVRGDVEPVEEAVEAIDEALEPLEAEWEDERLIGTTSVRIFRRRKASVRPRPFRPSARSRLH